MRNAYLEAAVDPVRELSRGEYYWHEVVGSAVRGVDGAELGTVRDVYRVAETEVFEVAGGPFGPFDLPAVRDFIRVFAPRRGEIVVDAEALDLRMPAERGGAGRPIACSSPADEQANGQDEAGAGWSVLMALEIDVLTLFPTMIEGPLAASIPGRIQERGLATVRVHDLRDWGLGRHRTVDDATYGGGAGMVLRPEPVAAALARYSAGPTRSRSCSTRRARCSASRGPSSWPPASISSWCAPATRASTSGSARWSTSSCRSATTS